MESRSYFIAFKKKSRQSKTLACRQSRTFLQQHHRCQLPQPHEISSPQAYKFYLFPHFLLWTPLVKVCHSDSLQILKFSWSLDESHLKAIKTHAHFHGNQKNQRNSKTHLIFNLEVILARNNSHLPLRRERQRSLVMRPLSPRGVGGALGTRTLISGVPSGLRLLYHTSGLALN